MIGIPIFRTRVLYVPQRPSLLPGTPRDFLITVSGFKAHNPKNAQKAGETGGRVISNLEDPIRVGEAWGVDKDLWDRNWSNLSGGEAQRIALASAVGLGTAEILLLDGQSVLLENAS